MAREGTFEPQVVPASWFENQVRYEGWFDEEALIEPVVGAPPEKRLLRLLGVGR